MISTVTRQKCFNHTDREAAAKCLECGRHFCRECVTEHEHRVICSACLAKTAKSKGRTVARLLNIFTVFQFITGFVTIWFAIFYLGQVLLKIPSEFHEGRLTSPSLMKYFEDL
jgi:hypothetical protein